MEPAFQRPDLIGLKHKLATLDMSTSTYIHTTSHTVPLNDKQYVKMLGLVTQTHPNMKYLNELEEFQVGTITHRHIRSCKRQLLGTIVG